MARQYTTGTMPQGLIDGLNETHRAVVGLETSKPHYDGSEYNASNVEQVPDSGAVTTLATAVNAANRIKAILGDHYSRGNAGSGKKIYAHKTADAANVIATADMSAGSTYEATLLASLIALVDELRTDYELHRRNLKADGVTSTSAHVAADATYYLGAVPTLTTFEDVTEALNNLKAQYEGHRAFSSGGSPHPSADSTNTISSPNAVSTNLDSLVMLANELRTDLIAHMADATAHSAADTFNPISGSAVGYPSGLFTLANELRTSYEAHRASTTYHESADSTNTISASAASTVAGLITLVAELYTDVAAHLRNAPVSQAHRLV